MEKFWLFGIGSFIASAMVLLGVKPVAMAQPLSMPRETMPREILLGQGFVPDPIHLLGKSGGQFPVNRVIAQHRTPTGLCLGYIDSLPNHILTLDAFFDFLAVRVDSEQDTTLIIQGPGGTWCSDDAEGHNPVIAGQWQAGRYQIWVGAYDLDQSSSYTLLIQSGEAMPDEI